MRRADRLFQIIQIMRRHKITTAARLADELEVSERTVYRDIRDLISSGVPISGEAGVGYALSKTYDFPPLMFTRDEIESLVLGARIVKSFGDKKLARAAEEILVKVEEVLPVNLKEKISKSNLYSVNFKCSEKTAENLEEIRVFITKQKKIEIYYESVKDNKTKRVIRPLSLFFTGPEWLLTAWCELRNDFRNFRVDRLKTIIELDESFSHEPGKTINDFFKRVNKE